MNFCTNGPMDTISVKSCTTIVDMRQNQDNTAFRRGSELALQANYWTGYLALARTNRLANHSNGAVVSPPFGYAEDRHGSWRQLNMA
jgi:hypothetical protein